jgi:hypothetical protein
MATEELHALGAADSAEVERTRRRVYGKAHVVAGVLSLITNVVALAAIGHRLYTTSRAYASFIGLSAVQTDGIVWTFSVGCALIAAANLMVGALLLGWIGTGGAAARKGASGAPSPGAPHTDGDLSVGASRRPALLVPRALVVVCTVVQLVLAAVALGKLVSLHKSVLASSSEVGGAGDFGLVTFKSCCEASNWTDPLQSPVVECGAGGKPLAGSCNPRLSSSLCTCLSADGALINATSAEVASSETCALLSGESVDIASGSHPKGISDFAALTKTSAPIPVVGDPVKTKGCGLGYALVHSYLVYATVRGYLLKYVALVLVFIALQLLVFLLAVPVAHDKTYKSHAAIQFGGTVAQIDDSPVFDNPVYATSMVVTLPVARPVNALEMQQSSRRI